MKTNYLLASLSAAAAAVIATACSSGSSSDGLKLTISASAGPTASFVHPDELNTAADEHIRIFRRADGMRIDMSTGLVNLVPEALIACDTQATLSLHPLLQALNPVSSAQAHGGHVDGPAGSTDVVPNGISVDLGSLAVRPGSYCQLELAIEPGSAAPLSGIGAYTELCYYPDSIGLSDADAAEDGAHSCIEVAAITEHQHIVLELPVPITLDATTRNHAITVVSRFEEWFDGVDMRQLATSSEAQAQWASNIAQALTVVDQSQQYVNLDFDLRLGADEAVCGQTYTGVGVGSVQELRNQGLRFYLSQPTMVGSSGSAASLRLDARSNGTVYQDDRYGVALIGDAQGCDSTTPLRSESLSATVAAGDYRQICFDLGVPFELNHSDPSTAPSPLNLTAMSWSWQYGRVFFRFDSVSNPSATPGNFFVHLGSTGCSNASDSGSAPPDQACLYPNLARICLAASAVSSGQPIVVNVAALLSESDIGVNTEGTAPGCMSAAGDPECIQIMPKFGLDYAYTPEQVIAAEAQSLFTGAQ